MLFRDAAFIRKITLNKLNMKNWKTNLAAIFTAAVGVTTAMGWISSEVASAILTIGVAFGFAVASDSKKKEY